MRMQCICLALVIVLLRSFAPAQWVSTKGPYDGVITSIAAGGTNLFAGTSHGSVFLSKNEGGSWAEVDTGLTGDYVYCLAISGEDLFAGTDSGVFHSNNNGAIWSSANTGLTSTNVRTLAVSPASPGKGPTCIFAGTDSGVFLSTNNGARWTAVNHGLSFLSVIALAMSDQNLVAGTAGGGYFLSTDNGANWIPVSTMQGSVFVHTLAANGTNLFAGISWYPLYVSSYGGVFLSTDDGASWTETFAYGGIEGGGLTVFDFAASGTTLFAATVWGSFGNTTNQGVYVSADSGKSWSGVNAGLADSSVFALAVNGHTLFAGTSEAGIWRRPLPEMITSVENLPSALPREFHLLQNYPNPFNPSTKIQFTIVNRQLTIVKVFDLVGREVATLVNEVKEPGSYTVEFSAKGGSASGGNGSNLASGVYFYRIQAGDFTQTKRLLLLK
jgi:Secretion system C-terminal sorting domain